MTEQLIGIIGGSGLGDALAERIADAELHDIDTPFGKPSAGILVGRLGKRKIAFLSRHGNGHKLPPSPDEPRLRSSNVTSPGASQV